MHVDDPQVRRLRRQHPVGSAIGEMVEHVRDTDAAEFFIRLSDDDQVASKRAPFEHALEGLEERGHAGLGVAGPAPESAVTTP